MTFHLQYRAMVESCDEDRADLKQYALERLEEQVKISSSQLSEINLMVDLIQNKDKTMSGGFQNTIYDISGIVNAILNKPSLQRRSHDCVSFCEGSLDMSNLRSINHATKLVKEVEELLEAFSDCHRSESYLVLEVKSE